ncbi:MAG: hypothetical protein AB7N71_13655 [Phycisphaerae bacterium]
MRFSHHVNPMRRRHRRGDSYSAGITRGQVLTRQQTQYGRTITVFVTTDQDQTILDWYVNGKYAGRTRDGYFSWRLKAGYQIRIDARPVRYLDERGDDYAPPTLSRTYTIHWTAADGPVDRYLVDMATGQSNPDPEDWENIGYVAGGRQWSYSLETPELDDVTWYWFRIRPIDIFKNTGDVTTIGPIFFVGLPTAPDVLVEFSDSTQQITVSEA